MARPVTALLLALLALCLVFQASVASEQAQALRAQNGLSEFTPSEAFLSGYFVADEINPTYVFGTVKDFAASRACPTVWLIESAEKKRIEAVSAPGGPLEYTLALEEDCPGKVVHYLFVDRSQASLVQWMDWRKQFHKSKTDGQYNVARDGLDKAMQAGFQVSAELRFIERAGELSLDKPEAFLVSEKKVPPLYDIAQGKALTK